MTIDEAINILKQYVDYDNPAVPDFYTMEDAIKVIIEALEQEPRTGHWEWVQYDGNPNIGNWHCSECRSIVIECVSKEKKGGIPLYKYCPQCGAKIE